MLFVIVLSVNVKISCPVLSRPVSGIMIPNVIISCHFCFLQDLFLMRCSLSIFFGFGSRITEFI